MYYYVIIEFKDSLVNATVTPLHDDLSQSLLDLEHAKDDIGKMQHVFTGRNLLVYTFHSNPNRVTLLLFGSEHYINKIVDEFKIPYLFDALTDDTESDEGIYKEFVADMKDWDQFLRYTNSLKKDLSDTMTTLKVFLSQVTWRLKGPDYYAVLFHSLKSDTDRVIIVKEFNDTYMSDVFETLTSVDNYDVKPIRFDDEFSKSITVTAENDVYIYNLNDWVKERVETLFEPEMSEWTLDRFLCVLNGALEVFDSTHWRVVVD